MSSSKQTNSPSKKNKQSQLMSQIESISTKQYFKQYQLSQHNLDLLDQINKQQLSRKINALIASAQKRQKGLLYRGDKFYYEDLQIILQKYPQLSLPFFKTHHINVSKNSNKVHVQCHNCAKFTEVNKFCPFCQHIHYCHEGCEMKNKYTHQRQECRPRPFPKTQKSLQVELHIGSDLGQNVHLGFQHQVSMTLLLRGQKLLQNIYHFFTQTIEGKSITGNYIIQNDGKMLKFINEITNYQIGTDKVQVDSLQKIIQVYTKNKILNQLQIYLIQKGALLNKIIRQIHDNHFRVVFIFDYPF